MNISLICIGKIKVSELLGLQEIYLKKLKPYPFELIQLPDGKGSNESAKLENEKIKIEKAIKGFQKVILLDEKGVGKSSVDFSNWIKKLQLESVKSLAFVLGSSHGFHREIKEKISSKFQISKMTLTHEMARVVFMEQVYRAFTIIKGLPYHH